MSRMRGTVFAEWMKALGLNGKQVTDAGALLGYSKTATQLRHLNDARLTGNDRKAMSAIRARLPPWSPATDSEIARVGAAYARLTGGQEPPDLSIGAGFIEAAVSAVGFRLELRDRLIVTALRAGLPEWSIDIDPYLLRVSEVTGAHLSEIDAELERLTQLRDLIQKRSNEQ